MSKALMTLYVLLAIARSVTACVCVTGSPKDDLKRATIVFVGEVLSYDGRNGSVRTIEVFKGHLGSVVSVLTGPYGESCGYGSFMRQNSRHLFYATASQNGAFAISTCGRTRPVEFAECDLRLLRKRARWWSSRISSFRVAKWLHLFWPVCSGPFPAA